jgi:putative tricarboxylic transport membrane protein
MTKYDRISTLFFMGLAIAIIVESIRLGRGSLSNPGPGLIPLGSGLVIGILSLIVFVGTFRRSSGEGLRDKAGKFSWNIISALISMVAFGFLVNPLGFYTATFLWLAFVCRWIARMGWKATIMLSVIATFSTWLLFGFLLEIRFPHGIMGF